MSGDGSHVIFWKATSLLEGQILRWMKWVRTSGERFQELRMNDIRSGGGKEPPENVFLFKFPVSSWGRYMAPWGFTTFLQWVTVSFLAWRLAANVPFQAHGASRCIVVVSTDKK